MIKSAHIDCEKDTYDVLNDSIVKPFNGEIKMIMNKDLFFYMWNEDKKDTVEYFRSEETNELSFTNINNTRTRILIFGDLAYFATAVGKVDMPGCWCHWCDLSTKEW